MTIPIETKAPAILDIYYHWREFARNRPEDMTVTAWIAEGTKRKEAFEIALGVPPEMIFKNFKHISRTKKKPRKIGKQ